MRIRTVAGGLALGVILMACGNDAPEVTDPAAVDTTPAPATPEATPIPTQEPAAEPVQPTPRTQTVDFTPCPPVHAQKPAPSGIQVTLEIPKTVFAADERVPFVLRLRHTGSQPVQRSWGDDEPDWDVWVTWEGDAIWRDSHGADLRGAEGSVTYQPGEERTQETVWPTAVCGENEQKGALHPQGAYAARGYFSDRDGGWYSNEVTFEIR